MTHCLIGCLRLFARFKSNVKACLLERHKRAENQLGEMFHIWTELAQCLSFEEEKCGLESELTHKGWVKPSISHWCLRADLVGIPMANILSCSASRSLTRNKWFAKYQTDNDSNYMRVLMFCQFSFLLLLMFSRSCCSSEELKCEGGQRFEKIQKAKSLPCWG